MKRLQVAGAAAEILNAIEGRGLDEGRSSIGSNHPHQFVALRLGMQTI
ncbi:MULTISPECIES: hypothetical protein [unclassified Bradyrhizobium]